MDVGKAQESNRVLERQIDLLSERHASEHALKLVCVRREMQ